jgi:hypothetical protein
MYDGNEHAITMMAAVSGNVRFFVTCDKIS